MTIIKYGVTLKRVKHEHIEMIREWRNDKKISKHMFFRAVITPAMQEEWFRAADNDQNYYFVIYMNEQPCGLISISSIDFETKNAFAGLFIYDDKYLGTDIPVRSSLSILDVFFGFTNVESIYAKVRDSNLVAHQYNTALGFKRVKKIEQGQGYEYCLKKENYYQSTIHLRTATAKLYGGKTILEFDKNNEREQALKESFLSSMYTQGIPADLEVK